jgi:hypothetical protein
VLDLFRPAAGQGDAVGERVQIVDGEGGADDSGLLCSFE